MQSKSKEREELLSKYLEVQAKLQQLEEENNLLKETNYRLAIKLEEKDSEVVNLFSYIEDLRK